MCKAAQWRAGAIGGHKVKPYWNLKNKNRMGLIVDWERAGTRENENTRVNMNCFTTYIYNRKPKCLHVYYDQWVYNGL